MIVIITIITGEVIGEMICNNTIKNVQRMFRKPLYQTVFFFADILLVGT